MQSSMQNPLQSPRRSARLRRHSAPNTNSKQFYAANAAFQAATSRDLNAPASVLTRSSHKTAADYAVSDSLWALWALFSTLLLAGVLILSWPLRLAWRWLAIPATSNEIKWAAVMVWLVLGSALWNLASFGLVR
jgi:hypothetical protein